MLLLCLGVVGCSWTSDGGVTGRYESNREGSTQSAEGSWEGEPIEVVNPQGSIQIVGVAGKTNLSMRARFVAGANGRADAEAAFADIERSLSISRRDGRWVVECGQASERHGSAVPSSTGCTSMVVEVPAGTEDKPIELSARTSFGGIHATGLWVSRLALGAPFGLVAAVEPAAGATIDMTGGNLVSGFCSTILSVPETFAADQAELTVDHPDVKMASNPDDPAWTPGVELRSLDGYLVALPPRSAAFRGTIGKSGEGATSVRLHASIGKAVLGAVAIPAYDPFNECKNVEPIRLDVEF